MFLFSALTQPIYPVRPRQLPRVGPYHLCPMGFIDIGVNLTSNQLQSDRDEVVAHARDAQVPC